MTSRIGLALSGGGFRATLYHMGVVRYLRDAGVLESVTDIASVSGGSILGAHLALNWDRYNGSDEQFDEVASELIRFIQFDVRNHIVRRLPLMTPFQTVARCLKMELPGFSANAILESYYRQFLFGDRRLFELPEKPCLHILATNVSDGVMAAFNRTGLHIQERNAEDNDVFEHIPGQTASVAKVVGASSAFPGFFPPVEFSPADLGVREGHFENESFTDGGVYDNLGTRAFLWLQRFYDESFSRVYVSDAGKPFQILSNASLGFIAQSIRASDILWDRVWQLERDNFGDQNGFVFAPATLVVNPEHDPHALHPVVQSEISMIRTDLDHFSDLEINALAVHGYEVAREMNRLLGGDTSTPARDGPAWEPLPGSNSILVALANATEQISSAGTARTVETNAAVNAAEKLRRSRRRKVWSTLADWSDWPTYVYLIVAVVLFGVIPVYTYRVHRHAQMLTDVIDSIAAGDPDIRLVLDLVQSDPTDSWEIVPIEQATTAQTADLEGVEILSHSRIVDLREGSLSSELIGDFTKIRLRDRIRLRFLEETKPRKLIFHTALPLQNVEYRRPADQPPLVVREIPLDTDIGIPLGQQSKAIKKYELEFDLSKIPFDQTVTLELASIIDFMKLDPGRMPLVLTYNPDLLTVWMLFSESHPYRSYRLMGYPIGMPESAKPMNTRYTIDHPYGQLIGWSLINPKSDMVYECRWTTE